MNNQNRVTLSRRSFLALIALARCTGAETASPLAMDGRLKARPGKPSSSRLTASWLHVPRNVKEPAPLIIALHGAGGRGAHTLEYVRGDADRIGAIVIAPDSLGRTWDVIGGEIGPDVERINGELELVFAGYAIDGERVAVSGFSDGASYALTLGIANGDLFTHVIAYSPGFLAPPSQVGVPRIFISHGTRDEILPIDRCSRRIAPALQQAGYDVRYREFDGGHTVPGEIANEAMDWFVRSET